MNSGDRNYSDRSTGDRSYAERSKRRNFGESWWGQAWVEAIEASASLDSNRLPRGRTYARWGYVGELNVEPGVVFALVEGSDSAPYRTAVRVPALAATQWDALFDIVARKVAHAAALADGELTSDLIDDALAAGIDLLPSERDISTTCSCPDEAEPCKHAAAVCYLFADLLDDDPFVLLELRGRTQDEVATALRERRRAGQDASPRIEQRTDDTVLAREVFDNHDDRAKAPKVPRPPRRAGEMGVALHQFPRDSGIDSYDLAALAATAAQRASDMSSGLSDSGASWTVEEDLAWRASLCAGDEVAVQAIAERASVDADELLEDARIWSSAGRDGYHDVRNTWVPEQSQLSEGAAALADCSDVRVEHNALVCDACGVKLLLGRSNRWYRFEKRAGAWRFEGIEDFEL